MSKTRARKIEVLRKARELVATRWTKGDYYSGSRAEGCTMCAVAALYAAATDGPPANMSNVLTADERDRYGARTVDEFVADASLSDDLYAEIPDSFFHKIGYSDRPPDSNAHTRVAFIIEYNDHDDTDHDEAQAWFQRALMRAKRGEPVAAAS